MRLRRAPFWIAAFKAGHVERDAALSTRFHLGVASSFHHTNDMFCHRLARRVDGSAHSWRERPPMSARTRARALRSTWFPITAYARAACARIPICAYMYAVAHHRARSLGHWRRQNSKPRIHISRAPVRAIAKQAAIRRTMPSFRRRFRQRATFTSHCSTSNLLITCGHDNKYTHYSTS